MKRKFSLLFNIATLVLCISAIAFGVYSAKTASLNVSGTVGFTAHDCKVAVTGTIVGHATTPDGEPIATAQPIEGVTVPDKTTLGLGTVYFSDLTSEGTINPIILTLYFENLSDFDVKVDITDLKTITGVTIEIAPNSVIMSDKSAGTDDKKKPVVVKLTCESTSTGITPANKQILQVNMAKYTAPQATGFAVKSGEINGVNRNYVTMGTYNEEALKWYIFAQGNGTNMTAVSTSIVGDNQNLPAGTYWFISQYVLDCDTVNGEYGIKFDANGSQIYKDSGIQTYLNNVSESANRTESFAKKYNFSADSNATYNYLMTNGGRTLPTETGVTNVKDTDYTLPGQYFWLLSVTELTYLAGEAVSVYNTYDSLIAQDATSSHATSMWWLRSPFARNGNKAFYVYYDGRVSSTDVGNDRGVRAAFQITISG